MRLREKPANTSVEEQANSYLQTVDFYAVVKDWSKALEAAEAAIAANPKLIRAHMLAGDAKKVRGDMNGALKAYVTAKRLFDEQYPDSYEKPYALIQMIEDLAVREKH